MIRDAELKETARQLGRVRSAGVTQALVGNLGHVALTRMAGMDARGDYSLNIFNSYSMDVAASAGLLSATASFELTMEQIKQLSKPLETEIIVYGRLPVMLTERCLIKASAGPLRRGTALANERRLGGVYPVRARPCAANALYGPMKVFLCGPAGRGAARLGERDAAAVHKRGRARVRGGRKELPRQERIPAERPHARTILQRC